MAVTGEIEQRIAHRLGALRAERGWSLESLSDRTGISRATLSRLERCELSPTAGMLAKLCGIHGWTMSRLMADIEGKPPMLVRSGDQAKWEDHETGYQRCAVSPPGSGLRAELVEARLPPGAVIAYEASPVPGLEHHLWMLEGVLNLEVEGTRFRLRSGDCVRYVLTGQTRFECRGKRHARYVIAIVHL